LLAVVVLSVDFVSVSSAHAPAVIKPIAATTAATAGPELDPCSRKSRPQHGHAPADSFA
jgi:hypothetical protein